MINSISRISQLIYSISSVDIPPMLFQPQKQQRHSVCQQRIKRMGVKALAVIGTMKKVVYSMYD